jgi:5-formyltetrahydrofolate cyclo-ligase
MKEAGHKAAERERALEALRSLSLADRNQASSRIRTRLAAMPDVTGASTVLGFAPLDTEPGIAPLLDELRAEGTRILLPRLGSEPGSLEAIQLDRPIEALPRDGLGVRSPEAGTPVPPDEIELVLVPGLMFDTWGQRLGRGGGYYDRLLERLPSARLVGICHEVSMCDLVPVELHDHRVDWIVTESRTIDCTTRTPPVA